MYEKYSDEEIIEAYSSMLDYSGEISKEMSLEIESRGGLNTFKKKIENRNILTKEISRLSNEVYSLTSPDTNVEFIKTLIKSDILTREELNELIENKFSYYRAINTDRTVNSKTIIGSITGIVLGTILGGLLMHFLSKQIPGIYFYLIIPVYILNYFIIKVITKQSRANPVIFIACFLATIGATLLSVYISGKF